MQYSVSLRGLGGTVDSESALKFAGTLSRVRALALSSLPEGQPESLRSSCCGLPIHKKANQTCSSPILGYLCSVYLERVELAACAKRNVRDGKVMVTIYQDSAFII
ncbi:hypothetical protein PoB_001409000 [Plakobranchus ocellatus]|uniref:Uncharacterized protein n=1 Tax=Plakobranchus ocellatus TaxID=259542 RepID=A0AAV3YXH4_9GAST|nr:hypothetical protein PoB_001409000 [Plakobranchus ocellatus]